MNKKELTSHELRLSQIVYDNEGNDMICRGIVYKGSFYDIEYFTDMNEIQLRLIPDEQIKSIRDISDTKISGFEKVVQNALKYGLLEKKLKLSININE